MTGRSALLVADDLGYDPAIDAGILEAHRHGVVAAASALVTGPFAMGALERAPRSLAIGLHLDLPRGLGASDAEREIRAQFGRFEEIRGAPPAHVDGHRHVHAEPPVLEALLRVAGPLGLRVRALDPIMRDRIRAAGARACDAFVGDAGLRPCWTVERLVTAVGALSEGTTEIMLHPGRTPTHVRTSFGAEREIELAAAIDPRVREAFLVAGVSVVGLLPG
ncbi:MAG: ChbG/HpnK family deacetylase [Deltaproteobacteria bacterium]